MKAKKTTAATVTDILKSRKNLAAVHHLIDDFKVLHKIAYAMRQQKVKKYDKGKRAVAKLLGLKTTQVDTLTEHFGADSARDFFIKKLLDAKLATKLWDKYTGYDGKKLTTPYDLHQGTFKIKEKLVVVEPYSVKVKAHGAEFLMIPGSTSNYQDKASVAGRSWIIFHKDKVVEVKMAMEKLLAEHDPIKGQVVTFGNQLEIIELKEKFGSDQVVISDNLKEEIDLIVNMFKNHETLVKQNVPFKRGVLLSGVPGTGKTTVVQAMARKIIEAGGTVFIIAAQQLNQESVYKYVNRFKPVLMVYEDFDLMAAHRGHGATSVRSDFLNVLEGSLGVDGVITLATTNVIEDLDQAAIRHGRIDKIYPVDLPSYFMKVQLLKLHLEYYKVTVQLEDASEALKGFLDKAISGAAISSIILGARQRAAVEEREVTAGDLRWAATGERNTKESLGFASK